MPRLAIPERYRAGVAGLGSMAEGAFSAFLTALETGLSADNSSDLAAMLVNEGGQLSEIPDLDKIIDAAASMQGVYQESHVPLGTFGKDVADALSVFAPALAKKIDSATLSQRVVKIAEAKRLDLTEEKIISLGAEVERQYCCSRILTDVRAAFSDDASVLPKAMTILHTLRIGYLDDTSEHREFYLSVDNDDLLALKESIDRALTKSKTLEALLAKADCRLFE